MTASLRTARWLPYAIAFFSSLCIMVLELVASRLVGRHVGMSLGVWTSVIGIILGGICLGNVLGGRLADRIDPRAAVGPLFAWSALLTLSTLWVNSVMGLIPTPDSSSPMILWDLRTILIVTLNFLVPATVLGMVSPVVAKIAVEQSSKSGTALGDVYTCGAIGSILGTFLAGFWLIYMAPTSTIVTVVAAGLVALAVVMGEGKPIRLVALAATACLGLGSIGPIAAALPAIRIGPLPVNAPALAGHALALVAAVIGLGQLRASSQTSATTSPAHRDLTSESIESSGKVKLGDLAFLAFLASLAFMALEMVAGRMVQRHLGSSVYNWTSVIGVLLGGLSLGNYLGGKLADNAKDQKRASWLFLIASVLTLSVLLLERFDLVENTLIAKLKGETVDFHKDAPSAFLSKAITMSGYPWWFRVLTVTAAVFFLPAVAMGTFSPLVAKLAVDRMRREKRTGTAIGQVYAWGMVGSILGTFLTGFLLIDLLGTKGVVLAITVLLAMAATALGSVWHAAWAGIPLGLAMMSILPIPMFQNLPITRLVREKPGDPGTSESDIAYVDETNYYYVKVENDPYLPINGESEDDFFDPATGLPLKKRTLVLDNLIHGYFLLGHPEHIEYDYEFIYAQVAHRVAVAKARSQGMTDGTIPPLATMFLGGGAYTFPRYLQHRYPGTTCDVAEIDPAVTRANRIATGLLPSIEPFEKLPRTPDGQPFFVVDGVTIRLGPRKWPTREDLKEKTPEEFEAALKRAEEVARADHRDFEKSTFPTIQTTFGDARQFVERHRGDVKYDVIFGDAFNDFSVPWHLTTREFNDKLARLLTDDGVYMINIIDIYKSDRKSAAQALADAEIAAVEAALKGSGAQGTRLESVARRVVNGLDDKRQGVATWPLARAAAEAVADVPGLSPPDPAPIASRLAQVEEKVRGTKEAMLETVAEILKDANLGGELSALSRAVVEADLSFGNDTTKLAAICSKAIARGRGLGGFLSAWAKTARDTFPYVSVFGTDESPGAGLRETFVVVVSRQPIDLEDLGKRPDDPKFFVRAGVPFEPEPFNDEHLKALEIRANGIVLTDDYAPVENLLAPVAATRGDDD